MRKKAPVISSIVLTALILSVSVSASSETIATVSAITAFAAIATFAALAPALVYGTFKKRQNQNQQ